VWHFGALPILIAPMPTILHAQINLQNFGLRIPGNTIVQARPGLTPGVGGGNSQAPAPVLRGMAPTFVPVPINPSVASDSLGFFNESYEQLQFQLSINDTTQVVTLQPHQIIVIHVGVGTQLKGTIGTGTNDSVSSFSAGKLYAVRAEGDHWVFAVQ
jgi:hypothetical protein